MLVFAGLEMMTVERASVFGDTTTAGNVVTDETTMVKRYKINEPNEQPESRVARSFQMTLTLDVRIHEDDRMSVSLSNNTGMYMAFPNEALRDG